MNNILETLNIKGFDVHILVSHDTENPLEWGNATLLTAHRRYTFGGDRLPFDANSIEEAFDWHLDGRGLTRRDVIWLPVYLYDHSGLPSVIRLLATAGTADSSATFTNAGMLSARNTTCSASAANWNSPCLRGCVTPCSCSNTGRTATFTHEIPALDRIWRRVLRLGSRHLRAAGIRHGRH